MHKTIKYSSVIGTIVFLLAACGRVEPVASSVPDANQSPSAVPVARLAPESLSQWVGLKYPPIPDDLSENFALLIQGSADHSLSLISNGQQTMVWLSRMTHRDSEGNAFWEVKDILDMSDLGSGLVLLPDGCSLDGVPDNEIIVVGSDEVIQLAWRANTALDVFEVIPTDGVECQSDKAWPLE